MSISKKAINLTRREVAIITPVYENGFNAGGTMEQIMNHLEALYGQEAALKYGEQLEARIAAFRKKPQKPRKKELDEGEVVIITYGDQFRGRNRTPLQNLKDFSERWLGDLASTLHILPCYPYTSDDGFSVVDYKQVDPALGTWEDIAEIQNFRLMLDFVCNHISAGSPWFQAYLRGEAPYDGFFIETDPAADLSAVTRPRALPLLTAFETPAGQKHLWTTFSEDQIDLNFENPEVLLAMIDVLLFYVEQGADLLRLDAVGFLWKRVGTACMHLPETHQVIQLMKAVLDRTAPEVVLITETNVPHRENISYFGDGTNEARMVYQFPLPPLTLYTLFRGDATVLTSWAAGLEAPSEETTFFNFLASHDGVGVNPARGLVPDEEIQWLIEQVRERGGLISYKSNPDGSQSAYEMNVSYFDALNRPGEPVDLQVKRFAAAQAIALSLAGVPGLYIHSVVGSRNDLEGVSLTGRNRSINREKFEMDALEQVLQDPDSLRRKVYDAVKALLRVRRRERAFCPTGGQRVLSWDHRVFAVLRTSPEGDATVLALQNITAEAVDLAVPLEALGFSDQESRELLTGDTVQLTSGSLKRRVQPYETVWLKLRGFMI